MQDDTFDAQRRRLLRLAYRILGSVADAEDAVQETYLRWEAADRTAILAPAAWLTTCCTRLCIDLLQSGQRARTEYVGTWLPEPLHLADDGSPEQLLELANTVSTAFIMLLERLQPRERAAYLLREVFDEPYSQVATVLGVSEPACRQLVSRARARVGTTARGEAPPVEQQEHLLRAFHQAVRTGRTETLAHLLSRDVRLSADGGGKVPAVRDIVRGRGAVLQVVEQLHAWWLPYTWQLAPLSGGLGLLLHDGPAPSAAVTLDVDARGAVQDFFVVRNPAKLAHLVTLVGRPL